MTDIVSHPVGVSSPASMPPSCPTDLELARFVEGTLDQAARGQVLEHLDACDDCREVVATAAAALGEDSGERADIPLLVSPPWWRRRATTWTAAVAMAALAVFALRIATMPAPAAGDAQALADPWSAIAEAVGPSRRVEARLSGLPAHVPLAPPTRAATPDADFALQALAGRLADAAAAPIPDFAARAAARHAAGAAALVAGRPADAVALLESALADTPAAAAARAAILADLSAAHAELGEMTSREHWTTALRAADDALALDASNAAARFNRALALERLARTDEALAAWHALADDASAAAAWREEAAGHVRALVP